jgi:hypothetical protein
MIIRREQYDALRRCSEVSFEARLALFLLEQFPEEGEVDQAQFDETIRVQIATARTFGLETEQQIATYAVSACLLGSDFHKHFPAANQVLESKLLNADDKARWLDSWTRTLFEALEAGA